MNRLRLWDFTSSWFMANDIPILYETVGFMRVIELSIVTVQ